MLLGMVKQKHQDRCGNETLDHAQKEWAATTAQRAVHARRVHEEELAHAVQSARKIAEDDAMARAATYHSVLISSAITAAVADLKQHLLEEHSQAMQETASKAVHMVASSAESILDPRRASCKAARDFDLVLDKAESALSPRLNALRWVWRVWRALSVRTRATTQCYCSAPRGLRRCMRMWLSVCIQLVALRRGGALTHRLQKGVQWLARPRGKRDRYFLSLHITPGYGKSEQSMADLVHFHCAYQEKCQRLLNAASGLALRLDNVRRALNSGMMSRSARSIALGALRSTRV